MTLFADHIAALIPRLQPYQPRRYDTLGDFLAANDSVEVGGKPKITDLPMQTLSPVRCRGKRPVRPLVDDFAPYSHALQSSRSLWGKLKLPLTKQQKTLPLVPSTLHSLHEQLVHEVVKKSYTPDTTIGSLLYRLPDGSIFPYAELERLGSCRTDDPDHSSISLGLLTSLAAWMNYLDEEGRGEEKKTSEKTELKDLFHLVEQITEEVTDNETITHDYFLECLNEEVTNGDFSVLNGIPLYVRSLWGDEDPWADTIEAFLEGTDRVAAHLSYFLETTAGKKALDALEQEDRLILEQTDLRELCGLYAQSDEGRIVKMKTLCPDDFKDGIWREGIKALPHYSDHFGNQAIIIHNGYYDDHLYLEHPDDIRFAQYWNKGMDYLETHVPPIIIDEYDSHDSDYLAEYSSPFLRDLAQVYRREKGRI